MKADYLFEVFMPGDIWLLWKRFEGKVTFENGALVVRPAQPDGIMFRIPEGPVGAQSWRVRAEIRNAEGTVVGREVMTFAGGNKTLSHAPYMTINVR